MKDIGILREALPYLRRHRRQTVVVKLGGEIAGNPKALAMLAESISLLAHVNIRMVTVHGGGPQATKLSQKLGLETKMVGGRRVTDAATLEVAKMAFAGQINVDILGALRVAGVRAVGLSGVDADILIAARRPPAEVQDDDTGRTEIVDFGHVGDIVQVNTELLSLLVEHGYVPVISSLGCDEEGNALNVNADTVAMEIARDLSASKLISLTSVPGLLRNKDDPSSVISRLSLTEARTALSDGTIQGGMIPKVKTLVEAVEGGVRAGIILSGLDHDSLLAELFTDRGVGTLIERDLEDEPKATRASRGVVP